LTQVVGAFDQGDLESIAVPLLNVAIDRDVGQVAGVFMEDAKSEFLVL
jgi:hypothetical protein|tara:strand:- start:212 stop:355 length:144 start_codon:yes stop_codon:yes gene_type:complete